MSERLCIGWKGMGKMGQPMSERLTHAGYAVTEYNRTREKVAELAARGVSTGAEESVDIE